MAAVFFNKVLAFYRLPYDMDSQHLVFSFLLSGFPQGICGFAVLDSMPDFGHLARNRYFFCDTPFLYVVYSMVE